VHSGQPKPNLRRKRKALNGSEGLLETVGLEVMAEGVRAATHSPFGKLGGEDAKFVKFIKRFS